MRGGDFHDGAVSADAMHLIHERGNIGDVFDEVAHNYHVEAIGIERPGDTIQVGD
jgi:hypothetical protein